MIIKPRIKNIFIILFLIYFSSSASAEMIITLSGNNDSSLINFTLSGESQATMDFDSPFTGMAFDITNENPFPDGITTDDNPFGAYSLVSGAGYLTDQTKEISVPIIGIFLQDSELFGHARFGVITDDVHNAFAGDIFTWSGSGVFDISSSGLNFSDLALGQFRGISDPVSYFEGSISITSVPVPAAWLFFSSSLTLIFIRKFVPLSSSMK